MHHRRVASFLIGLWVAGSLLMMYIGTQNMTNVASILSTVPREGAKIVDKIGAENAQLLLRFHAAEQTRTQFETWELTQVALGLALAAVLYLGTHVSRYIVALCGIMLLIVGFVHFVVTPEVIWIGRGLDFAPGASRNRIWTLYALYAGLDALKLLMAAIIAGYLFRFKTRTSRHEPELSAAGSHSR